MCVQKKQKGEKIMKIFTAKVFNVFTIALSALFFLSVAVTTISSINKENQIALEFERLLADIENYNYEHNRELDPQELEGAEAINEAMFDNGTDAFLHAYYEYINAESYNVVSRGTTTNSVLGLNIETQSKNVMIKYTDGSASYELISYEPGNTYKRTSAINIYYDSQTNFVYMRSTNTVNKVNDDLIAVYNSEWEYDSVSYFVEEIGIMPGESPYDFSKRAVVEEAFYNEVKSGDTIKEYQTQIISNPTLAGGPFAKVANYIGNATRMPVITQMKANAIINADGTMKALELNDKFEVRTKVPVLGERNVLCEARAVYNFIQVGGELTIEKPDVSNAVRR